MTHYRVSRCPCPYASCKDWHVEPYVATQGAGFPETRARFVADLLRTLDGDMDVDELAARIGQFFAKGRHPEDE